MTSEAPFDPLTLLTALSEAGVEYVLIGGVAARLHGSPSLTRDVDICHRRSAENLERLAQVLRDLGARLRGVDDLKGEQVTFTTNAGDLDLLAMPAGVDGYEELIKHAQAVRFDDLVVSVADLDDLIRMKRAASRPKDRIEVEILAAIKDEQ